MSDELLQVWRVSEYGKVTSGKCQRITEKSIWGFVPDEELACFYGSRPSGRRSSRFPAARWSGTNKGVRFFLTTHEARAYREEVLGDLLSRCRYRIERELAMEAAILRAQGGEDVDLFRVKILGAEQ